MGFGVRRSFQEQALEVRLGFRGRVRVRVRVRGRGRVRVEG